MSTTLALTRPLQLGDASQGSWVLTFTDKAGNVTQQTVNFTILPVIPVIPPKPPVVTGLPANVILEDNATSTPTLLNFNVTNGDGSPFDGTITVVNSDGTPALLGATVKAGV